MFPSIHPLIHGLSAGWCPLTSSPDEFLGYWAGSGILGYRPCWCPSPFPSPSILGWSEFLKSGLLTYVYTIITISWIRCLKVFSLSHADELRREDSCLASSKEVDHPVLVKTNCLPSDYQRWKHDKVFRPHISHS